LLCTISAARERGHEVTDIPVHVYGPPGLTDYLNTMMQVSNTYLEISIIVHEFSMTAVPADAWRPILVNERSKLWSVVLPPDQLNETCGIDGDIANFMPNQGRATKFKGTKASGGVLAFDPRAGFFPMAPPPAGDPSLAGSLDPLSLRWTIRIDTEGIITVMPLAAGRPTVAYALHEADRIGNIVLDRIDKLGVPRGNALGVLKERKPVLTPEGRVVTPDMVMTVSKPGRRILILGTCTDASCLLAQPAAHGADVLVAGALRPSGEKHGAAGDLMGAAEMGSVANQLGARHVLLSRFHWSLHGRDTHPWEDPVLGALMEQVAGGLAPQQRVTAVHDTWVHVVEKHEGRAWAEPEPDVPEA
ncbi:hypothetical protein FOA52_006824, partial [Chlamydomonas sp. UWO 241]